MTPVASAVVFVAVALAAGSRPGFGRTARRRLAVAPRRSFVLTPPESLHRRLVRADVAEPAVVLTRWVQAVVATIAVAVVVPTVRIVVAVALIGPVVAVALVGDRASRRRRSQLPAALEAVAAGLRSGSSVAQAVEQASQVGGPLGPELAAVAAQVAAGRRTVEALRTWSDGAADPETAVAAAALTVAATVGGPGARAIDGAAASLRDRHATDDELTALATQGRASAVVLTVTPVAFAVLLASIDPDAGSFLFGTSTGWLCAAAGFALDAAGAWWMAVIVRRAR